MGSDATASVSYGFIIPQPQVLKLLQKLQNSKKKIKDFSYSSGEPHDLENLLDKHFEEKDLGDFEMSFLRAGSDDFKGMAIAYNGIEIESVRAWGFECLTIEPLSALWKDEELVEEANDAFKRLSEDSLFKELGIVADPEWLLGCTMSC